jgi:hypothetical protein
MFCSALSDATAEGLTWVKDGHESFLTDEAKYSLDGTRPIREALNESNREVELVSILPVVYRPPNAA